MGKNSIKLPLMRESCHKSDLVKHQVVVVVFDGTGGIVLPEPRLHNSRVASELYDLVYGLPRGRTHLLHSTSLRWVPQHGVLV